MIKKLVYVGILYIVFMFLFSTLEGRDLFGSMLPALICTTITYALAIHDFKALDRPKKKN